MAAFAGLRGTGDFGTDERPKNFREMILWLDPNGMAPLTALMARARKETVDDPEYSWWEETLDTFRFAVTTDMATSDTTMISTSGDLLRLVKGDILQVEDPTESATYDDELVLVSAVTDADNIVVVRDFDGAITEGPILAGANVTLIGNVNEEGSLSRETSSRNPTKVFNYTQIFKNGFKIAGTTLATKFRTGDPWANDKKRVMFDHSTAMEWSFLFGRKFETNSFGELLRMTSGLRQFITTNVKIYTTTPTEDDFLDTIYPVFDYNKGGGGGGNERVVLAGNGFLNSLNKLARNSSSSRINFQGTIKVYGMELQKWVLPQGTLGVRTHPLMNTHGRYKNSAFFVDFSSIVYRPLRGRDTKFQTDIQPNNADYREAQWLTEVGLEVQHEKRLAYLGNFVV